MKVVILAGGFGTRLSEYTHAIPKPMVTIGDKPIIWHIMKTYEYYGFNEFVILLGYKGEVIKNYFLNYLRENSDFHIDLETGHVEILKNKSEKWKIHLVDTGLKTMTGGRISQINQLIGDDQFLLTYGDGVADIDINALIQYHNSQDCIATLTAIQPVGRFGALEFDHNGTLTSFNEKPAGDGVWVNGGFFVCNPEIFNYIEGDCTVFEREPLERLVKDEKLEAYKHNGFWQCMDTLQHKKLLDKLWKNDEAPWKVWE